MGAAKEATARERRRTTEVSLRLSIARRLGGEADGEWTGKDMEIRDRERGRLFKGNLWNPGSILTTR